MVPAHKLRDDSSRLKGQRILGVSSSPLLLGLGGLLKENLSMFPDLSTRDNLARFSPFTIEVITQTWLGAAKTYEGAAQGRSSVSKSDRIIAGKSSFDLASLTSRVT